MGKPVYDNAQVVSQLTTSWEGDVGTTRSWAETTVYYRMPTSLTDVIHDPSAKKDGIEVGDVEATGFVKMSAAKVQMAELAFELWDDLAAISLTKSTSKTDHAIQFTYSSSTKDDGTYTRAGTSLSGDHVRTIDSEHIWLSSDWTTLNEDKDIQPELSGFKTYIHEIGHAIGLSHPGAYNASDEVPATYEASAVYANDTRQHSVMSYFGGWVKNELDGLWKFTTDVPAGAQVLQAATPMVDDVLAIQAKYGADTTTRTGDTTYGFNSSFKPVLHTAGGDPSLSFWTYDPRQAIYDFDINKTPIFTIWDAAGSDTLDVSGFTTNQKVDLVAGHYSSVGDLVDNVAIAFGCVIENAVGGAGNDTITGNSSANYLRGGAGNDKINGGYGADKLDGGAGNDWLFGSRGDDLFVFGGRGFGKDTIADFNAPAPDWGRELGLATEHDHIQLDRRTFADFADVVAHSHQAGLDVAIALDVNNSLTIQNATLASLHASDFLFV